MYTKISDYVTCYNPYCIAIHIAYDTVSAPIRDFMSCVKALQTALLYSNCTAEKWCCIISIVPCINGVDLFLLYLFLLIYIRDIGFYNLLYNLLNGIMV